MDFGSNPAYVDYEKIYMGRFELLEKAFRQICTDQAYETFVEKNKKWLEDYSLQVWRSKQPAELLERVGGTTEDKTGSCPEEKRVELKEQMDFICFQQYEFAKQ